MTRALKPSFEVIDAKGNAIAVGLVGGEAVSVPAGTFSVRIKGASGKAVQVAVKPKESTTVEL